MFIIIFDLYFSDVVLATRITCFIASNPSNVCCTSWDCHLVLCFIIKNFVTNN